MWYWVQVVLCVAIFATLFRLYRDFLLDFAKHLLDHVGQAFILFLLYLIVYAQVGTTLGVPYLFWNEDPVTRFLAAVGCTLLLASLGVSAYYLIPEAEQADVMRGVELFLRRRTALVLPLGGWLEPAKGNAVELSRFLRMSRLPFLTLLLLPALLPLVFSDVPRYAPVASDKLEAALTLAAPAGLYKELNRHPDVSDHPVPYLIGVAVWVAGLLAGVFLVKVAIKVTSGLNPLVTGLDGLVFAPIRASVGRLSLPFGGATTRPAATRISADKLNSVVTFFVVVLAFYAALSTIFYGSFEPLGYQGVTPALAICALLGILAMASVLLDLMRPRFRLPVVAIALAWIGLANHDPFKLRFEQLPYYLPDRRPVELTEKTVVERFYGPRPAPVLLADEAELLPRWAAFARAKSARPERKPKLAVVCVSGGATRSAYWSAVVLDRLDRRVDPAHPFHNHVRVITGASGGMLGTAYYVKWLHDLHPDSTPGKRSKWPEDPERWYWRMPINSLRRVARSLALRETWRMLVPRWWEEFDDRGIVLERDWADLRNVSFSDLRPLEERGQLPSLIFSPMTVDDGRRLLISNLDLRGAALCSHDAPATPAVGTPPPALALNRGGALYGEHGATGVGPYSLSAIEFFKVFPAAGDFLVSTAVRMNATFPWVSPAVRLPSEPPLRVVDAAYYDNYGVNVAAAWLNLNRCWLIENTSGVVLVQIRDSLSRNDRLGFPEPETETAVRWALRGFEFLFTPVDAVLAARTTSAMFRNDQAVAAVGDTFARLTNDRAFFTTVVFENSAEVTVDEARADGDRTWDEIENGQDLSPELSSSTTVAMSWYLTQAEIRALEHAIPDMELRRGFAKRRENWIVSHAKQVADAPLGSAERAELLRRLDRARKFDERARNAERLQALAEWWREDHSVEDDAGSPTRGPATTPGPSAK